MLKNILVASTLMFTSLSFAATADHAVNCKADLARMAATYDTLMNLGNPQFSKFVKDGDWDAFEPHASSLAGSANMLFKRLSDNIDRIKSETNLCARKSSCGGLEDSGDQKKMRSSCAGLIKVRSSIISYTKSHAFDVPKIQDMGKKLQALNGTNGVRTAANNIGDKVIASLQNQQVVAGTDSEESDTPSGNSEVTAGTGVVGTTDGTVQAQPQAVEPIAKIPDRQQDRPASTTAFDSSRAPHVEEEAGLTMRFRPLSIRRGTAVTKESPAAIMHDGSKEAGVVKMDAPKSKEPSVSFAAGEQVTESQEALSFTNF